jgi:hypothetical protein
VDGPGGNEFSGTGNTVALSVPDQVDSLAVDGFTPSGAIGTYTVNITVSQSETDGNPGNNTRTETFQVDECIWAHDEGVCQQLQTAGPNNLTDQMEVGNYFDVANDGSFLYAIEVAMHEDTPDGALIYAVVRDENLDEVAISDEVEVDASTLNAIGGSNFITILFNDPVELLQGNAYCLMVGGFGGADQISVCTSGISDAQVSILSYPQAAAPNTFYVTKTPMVRGVLSAACAGVGIDENNALVSGVQAWPNPFSGGADIRFELATSAEVTVELRDMTGRLVRSERLGRRAAGVQQVRLDGQQLADGIYSYTIAANGLRTSGTHLRAAR